MVGPGGGMRHACSALLDGSRPGALEFALFRRRAAHREIGSLRGRLALLHLYLDGGQRARVA